MSLASSWYRYLECPDYRLQIKRIQGTKEKGKAGRFPGIVTIYKITTYSRCLINEPDSDRTNGIAETTECSSSELYWEDGQRVFAN